MKLRGVDFQAIRGLGLGLSLQVVCYTGVFLAIAVAARALSPSDFGIYASTVATATLMGSVMTLGSDRLLLRRLVKYGTPAGLSRRMRSPLLLPFAAANALAIVAVAALAAAHWVSWSLLFVAVLACLTAARIVLSAYFKHRDQRSLNVLTMFGLQPLFVAATFLLLPLAGVGLDVQTSVAWWFYITIFWEAVQFAVLLSLTGPSALAIDFAYVTMRSAWAYAKAGILLSIWVLLAMTGLSSVALGSLVLDPATIGLYTLAFRTSQVLGFFYSGASQLLIPLSVRPYAGAGLIRASREIRVILWATLAAIFLGAVMLALFGSLLTSVAFNVASPELHAAIVILAVGNVALIFFGIGDQIMVNVGLHRAAFRISVVAALLFLALFALNLALGGGIVGLAAATSASIALRCYLAYRAARQRIAVPVAVFDPLPTPGSA